MKKIAIFLVVFSFISCSSDSNLEIDILTGNFKELSPVEDRFTLNMKSQSFSYLKEEWSSSSSFSFTVLPGNRLNLSCNECFQTRPIIVSYKVIDANTFEIGNFIQEGENQIMTFERVEAKK